MTETRGQQYLVITVTSMENNSNFEANLRGNSSTPPTQVPRLSPWPAQNLSGSSSFSDFNGELKKEFKLKDKAGNEERYKAG